MLNIVVKIIYYALTHESLLRWSYFYIFSILAWQYVHLEQPEVEFWWRGVLIVGIIFHCHLFLKEFFTVSGNAACHRVVLSYVKEYNE